MDSHASWRLPDLQNLVFRFAALLAWAVAIYFFPDTIENDTDEKWEAYMAISAGAATVVAVVSASLLSRIGVRASALLIFLAAFVFYSVFLFRHHSLPDGNLYGLYATPYFCVVMGVYLSLRWNVGPLKLLLFSLAVNFAHFFATDYAIRFYEGTGTIFGPYIDQYNLPLDDTYLLSGLIGGIIGSFLSFLTPDVCES